MEVEPNSDNRAEDTIKSSPDENKGPEELDPNTVDGSADFMEDRWKDYQTELDSASKDQEQFDREEREFLEQARLAAKAGTATREQLDDLKRTDMDRDIDADISAGGYNERYGEAVYELRVNWHDNVPNGLKSEVIKELSKRGFNDLADFLSK